tara:strand:- start:3569 stop:3799 length:231 start_codon:yes stop_codon:yes gene_type:complete
MNNNIFINALLLSLVFAVAYYLEMKFLTKKPINLKDIVKYSLIVYISYLASSFLYSQIENKKVSNVTQVFTEKPNF